MWPDIETEQDFLNYSEVAEIAAEFLRTPELLPLSIGVFGGWGAGKSSMLRLIESELSKDFLIIKFDAWLYQGYDDARAALMDVIASRLIEATRGDATLQTKVLALAKRVNYFRLAGLALDGTALAMGLPTFGAITMGTEAIGRFISGSPSESDPQLIKDAAANAAKQAEGLVKPGEDKSPSREIEKFRAEYGEVLRGLKKTVVVFIDNLDRCLPRNAIHTLEAVRLFLFLPNSAFVIAADDEMIRHSVSEHYGQLGERHVTDYLDKLIQMPIRVPQLGVREVRAYMILLFASMGGLASDEVESIRKLVENNLRKSWRDEPIRLQDLTQSIRGPNKTILTSAFELADRIAPLLANSTRVGGNPRIVKRMLNVVNMRAKIAEKREIPLDHSVITKLALFERCMSVDGTVELYRLINESAEGKPKLLKTLEQCVDDPEKLQNECPKSWVPSAGFLAEWLELPPKLSDVNLRPAVYLSRETTPLRFTGSNLSSQGETAVRILLQMTSSVSAAGKLAIAKVPPEEHVQVMQSICSELRKVNDWTTKPKGFDGACSLADASVEAAEVLARHIKSLPLKKMPPWLNALLKAARWYTLEEAR